MAAQFKQREDEVPVPLLKDFFGKNEKPVWKIRGLDGNEIARAKEASEKFKNIKAVFDGLVSKSEKKKAEAIRELYGLTGDPPKDIAFRAELFKLGSLEEGTDYPLATKLCQVSYRSFYAITDQIHTISELGYIEGKAKPSGKTQKSKPH